ncbi:DUF1772 domain-containing protein [Paenibacillus sp. LMG 31461]|uniref:DUF1772 domain-containing protein n=1 Tax=Paenibacillus plantarum TaxID=2654975 RepID=A0ABX1XLB7_9BACL|nr:DUF1772 domain-containing protein [Paenibacillus plantarum]NOU69227.1 DUF1772 domain-containing protein [Paenibacillus plantarum]
MLHATIEVINLFLAGLLAGEEFVIFYGVRPPLAALPDQPHIQLRQALIRRLRVLVPSIYMPTLFSGVAILTLNTGPGLRLQVAGVIALLSWILITLFGTVPINKSILDWRPEAPPSGWQSVISRWVQLDRIRFWSAVIAFALFLIAVAMQLAGN